MPSRRNVCTTVFVFACCNWTAPLAAAPRIEQVNCPAFIDAASVHVANAPAGWTPFTQSSLKLKNIGVTYGPPQELADSVPVSDKTRKGKSVVKWQLDARPSEPKWVKCIYGDGHEVTLTKELAATTSECLATITLKAGETTIDMRCKSEQ